jgi:hypothetical protein
LIGPISYDEIAPALQQLLDKMQVGDITEPAPHAARVSDSEAGSADADEDSRLR